jgi:hypothetical protein
MKQSALLPPALLSASLVVNGIYRHMVFTCHRQLCNIKTERRISAFMDTGFLTVHPNMAFIVHRPEMQQHTSIPLGIRQFESAQIPYSGNKVFIADAAKLAFRAKGDYDLPVQLCLLKQLPGDSAVAKVKPKIPFSVQIHPVFPPHLGPGMFTSGDIVHLFYLLCPIQEPPREPCDHVCVLQKDKAPFSSHPPQGLCKKSLTYFLTITSQANPASTVASA